MLSSKNALATSIGSAPFVLTPFPEALRKQLPFSPAKLDVRFALNVTASQELPTVADSEL